MYQTLFYVYCAVCITLVLINNKEKQSTKLNLLPAINIETQYLGIYCMVSLADWLQGSYIYALYEAMGYSLDDIAILFLIGFLSSAISAPFVGMLTDYYGRRSGCLLFCVLYFGSCLTKFSHHFIVLSLGRVLGGISTALSQTAFESWLVSEHQNQGIFQ